MLTVSQEKTHAHLLLYLKKNCCDIFGGRGVENNKCYDMIYD